MTVYHMTGVPFGKVHIFKIRKPRDMAVPYETFKEDDHETQQRRKDVTSR